MTTLTCWDCGEAGHLASACPNIAYVRGDGGTWCGSCDERTRLVDLGDKMRRCPDCHPLRTRMLAQFRRCPACQMIVYAWDVADCGRHQEVGIQREHIDVEASKPRRSEDDLRALAAKQVAESRMRRVI